LTKNINFFINKKESPKSLSKLRKNILHKIGCWSIFSF